jgi:hypothetical protein
MDSKFINGTAWYILSVIRSGGPVIWSWGPEGFKATVYNGMAALRFSVNGFLHRGDVVAALNGGADMFEVYCLDGDDNVVSRRDDVCLDELVGVIDTLVEKDCPDEEYDIKRRGWLAGKSITVQKTQ